MRQRVDRNIQCDFLPDIGRDTSARAMVSHRERTAETLFAENGDEVLLEEEAFEVDRVGAIFGRDVIDLVKSAVDGVFVGEFANFFARENAIEFAPTGNGKSGVVAAAGGEEKSAIHEVFSEHFDFGFGENEFVVPVHEQERRFVNARVFEFEFALGLDGDRGGGADQLGQFLGGGAAVVPVGVAVFEAADEEGGDFLFRADLFLPITGDGWTAQSEAECQASSEGAH